MSAFSRSLAVAVLFVPTADVAATAVTTGPSPSATDIATVPILISFLFFIKQSGCFPDSSLPPFLSWNHSSFSVLLLYLPFSARRMPGLPLHYLHALFSFPPSGSVFLFIYFQVYSFCHRPEHDSITAAFSAGSFSHGLPWIFLYSKKLSGQPREFFNVSYKDSSCRIRSVPGSV